MPNRRVEGTVMSLVPPVHRAVLWHRGQLPKEEIPASYDVHLAGPLVTPSMKVHYHTYVGLFPDQGIYVAIKTGRRPERDVGLVELRDTITAAEVSRVDVRKQRQLVVEGGSRRSGRVEWAEALKLAKKCQLPVGFYAIGDTLGDERVLFLRVILNAPLGLVVEQFKRAKAQINFN
ncbi:MAG: hypothetical protein JWP06_401 [Candidatus Saccharibacteria bacterium]|nr:hypothetical protein [Candidatus Saccharibacteria bacterium]